LTLLLVVPTLAQVLGIWEGSPGTELGCNCKGSCSTSFFYKCHTQPYCQVESDQCSQGTAHQGTWPFGDYDYCTYESFLGYEMKTAKAKLALLNTHIQGGALSSADRWPHYQGKYPMAAKIFRESVIETFDAVADVFPMEREKLIHGVGVVGSIAFVVNNTKPGYTGTWKTGGPFGLIRFSSAAKPSSSGFTPGLAIKILRDGRPSANFMAMPSLDGQTCDETNFFKNSFKNHIAATSSLALKLVAKKFSQASFCPQMVGLSDLARDDTMGTEDEAKFPYSLRFEAPESTVVDIPCAEYTSTGFGNFAKLAPETKLFKVFAVDKPDGEEQEIGSIILKDQLTPSKFGDEKLFFKHQRMEDDFKLRPEWLEAIDKEKQCGMKAVSTNPPTWEHGCSGQPNDPADGDILV